MSDKDRYKMVELYDFKSRMCEYMRELADGDRDFIIRRYRKPVAIVLSTKRLGLNREAEAALAAMKLYRAAFERFAMQRRRIAIRARTTWPPHLHGFLRVPEG